jgi:hypothetical protein
LLITLSHSNKDRFCYLSADKQVNAFLLWLALIMYIDFPSSRSQGPKVEGPRTVAL